MISQILGSKGRVRLLTQLFKHGEICITELARKSNLNYTSTSRHVDILVRLGIVSDIRYGGVRMIKPVKKNMVFVFNEEYGAAMFRND